MTSRKQKLVDDQIEGEVIADLDDPSAWHGADNVGRTLQSDLS